MISLPVGRSGLNEPTPTHEVWLLDPSTGRLAQVTLAGVDLRAAVVALAPDGREVAYVTAGASRRRASGRQPEVDLWLYRKTTCPETVWIAPLDGSSAPRPMLELDAPVTRGFGADAEHIVDLVWTPDGTRLVAVSRQGGLPRARGCSWCRLDQRRLWRRGSRPPSSWCCPADIAPGATVPDPSGQWLVLMAHAAVAAGGRDVLMLCTVELRPGGTFREIADLGSAQRAPTTAAIAWAPNGPSQSAGGLALVAPVPADTSSGSGLFDLFERLRHRCRRPGCFSSTCRRRAWRRASRTAGTMTNVLAPVLALRRCSCWIRAAGRRSTWPRSIDPASRDASEMWACGCGWGGSGQRTGCPLGRR